MTEFQQKFQNKLVKVYDNLSAHQALLLSDTQWSEDEVRALLISFIDECGPQVELDWLMSTLNPTTIAALEQKYRNSMHPMIAHKSEQLADAYLINPLTHHKINDGVVMACKKFLNSSGFWQTNAEIRYN